MIELGISPEDASLFLTVGYGIFLEPQKLPNAAWGEGQDSFASITEESLSEALIGCFAKGWLQVVGESFLIEITNELRAGHFLGPICGMPETGTVDFTPFGAELWQKLCHRWNSQRVPFAYTDTVHAKSAQYFRTLALAEEAAERTRGDEHVVCVSGPIPIGPWRVEWWRRFEEGYRIDIEERWHLEGRGINGGESCHSYRRIEKEDLAEFRRVLDRHQVSLVEWILLHGKKNGPRRSDFSDSRWFVDSINSRIGIAITEADLSQGQEACLLKGWLRVLDRPAIDRIRELLRNDTGAVVLPITAGLITNSRRYVADSLQPGQLISIQDDAHILGMIDFTPEGAALYRTIMAEWLGSDWEDDLEVSNQYFCEVHRYCETEEGFLESYGAEIPVGHVVRAERVVPIGPWCVRWWERFPSGYRQEREIEESPRVFLGG